MIISLAGDGADHAELFSLLDHLTDEDELGDAANLSPGENEPGTLGGQLGTLLLTIASSGGVAAAAARVLTTWLRTRSGNLTIKVTRADGSSISVTGRSHSADQDERIIKDFLESAPSDTSS